MPDVRLDNIENLIDDLATDWSAFVVAAKVAATPRECVDHLDAGVVTLQAQVLAIADAIIKLPTKDIAIDLNTPAS
jgi:chromosome condensin MukBEF complex kleisin-like MukF subunit